MGWAPLYLTVPDAQGFGTAAAAGCERRAVVAEWLEEAFRGH
jgi:hypothetical protein